MSQSVSGLDHSTCTRTRPLPRPSAGPLTVNGISSTGPPGGYEGFSGGTPGGLASAIVSCGGPVASRPWRPATNGRVDGFTSHLNEPPGAFSSDVSVSANWIGLPIELPRSSRHTGEVEVWKLFEMRSVEP